MAVVSWYLAKCPHCGQGVEAYVDVPEGTSPRRPARPKAPSKEEASLVLVVPGSRPKNEAPPVLAVSRSESRNPAHAVAVVPKATHLAPVLTVETTAARATKASGWLFLTIALVVFILGFSWVFGFGLLFLASLLGG